MGVQAQLEQIAGSADPKPKAELYKQLLGSLIQAASEADLNDFVDHSECAAADQRSAPPGRAVNRGMVCSEQLLQQCYNGACKSYFATVFMNVCLSINSCLIHLLHAAAPGTDMHVPIVA
jgi:hypothetical protein